MTDSAPYTTRLLTLDTWTDFAALVEANNGVWGGCWCIGFHPVGITRDGTAAGNRKIKQAHVADGTVHQVLVYRRDECVGWCQFGPPAEVARIKNAKAYEKELVLVPDWRIGCIFTGSRHRRQGVARAGLAGALNAIGAAGGGVVEAYPEQVDDRPPPEPVRGIHPGFPLTRRHSQHISHQRRRGGIRAQPGQTPVLDAADHSVIHRRQPAGLHLHSAPEHDQFVVGGRDQIDLLQAVDQLRELGREPDEGVAGERAGHASDSKPDLRQQSAFNRECGYPASENREQRVRWIPNQHQTVTGQRAQTERDSPPR